MDSNSKGLMTKKDTLPTTVPRKCNLTLGPSGIWRLVKQCLTNIQLVTLGTKLSVLFLVIPVAIIAKHLHFGKPWVFALSLIALTPLAERISFLTEQIALCTGPTVGGLLNASCGNATELIISLLALNAKKLEVVKYSLLGSILSNQLLVLGSSLFCGGIANLRKVQKYDIEQVRVNSLLWFLGLLCFVLPLMFHNAMSSGSITVDPTLLMSRASSVVMLVAYAAYLFFQLKTHRLPSQEGDEEEEVPVMGCWSAFAWLAGLTALIAMLSDYVVDAIEEASNTWGLSVSFISIILLPIVGNAVEHASAIIFALRNKLDISIGVSLGSATQISMFVIPLNVIVAWMMGIEMDLDLKLLQTVILAFAIFITIFTLQDGNSHYMKGLVLMLFYVVIAACFFVVRTPLASYAINVGKLESSPLTGGLGA
ncbi:hypothetical protein Syun_000289 [Stephania yunnanensis]|uniref:Vacuolar cation/proton exchanger n=1 Tax=Stephania yunnanensis TaxID=152371 RepID=A0AAP0LFM8_9MAGN